MDDARLYAPAFQRNRDPILAGLRRLLPPRGLVLEVASGTGEHVAHFAAAFPALIFQPTDRDPAALASIDAWVRAAGVVNVLPASGLDVGSVGSAGWPVRKADAVLCINMIHIAPWQASVGLFAGAARVLPPGGVLIVYGPFDRAGVDLAPSNAAFDADLRARNPAWGLRKLESVSALAEGFGPPEVVEMPANNVMVAYRRTLLDARHVDRVGG